MSRELIVLTPERPDLTVLPEFIGEELKMVGLYVFDTADHLLVRIREPMLVSVPGETERLLDTDVPAPAWWVEIRAAADPPHARLVASRCAERLADCHGGTVWSASSS
ncbi:MULTISPECIES: hypothetical protein [Actinomadura]|uniref:Uncharacterized protein n=1 Tax=Actinomadura yumaensis TaxID=111807 RepID=A0ABW2CM69_9ACTN|nr:hypothetical protein [Actinomadura sp. J1-007]MWK34232.1 hypothetical protein [Actinomadura sp. J1-007]